jgi:hypothetical protein
MSSLCAMACGDTLLLTLRQLLARRWEKTIKMGLVIKRFVRMWTGWNWLKIAECPSEDTGQLELWTLEQSASNGSRVLSAVLGLHSVVKKLKENIKPAAPLLFQLQWGQTYVRTTGVCYKFCPCVPPPVVCPLRTGGVFFARHTFC